MYSVKMEKMVKEMALQQLTPEVDITERVITDADVNRPALQLAGFYEYFDEQRVQIIGKVETAYMKELEKKEKTQMFDKLFRHKIPCLIFSKDAEDLEFATECGIKYDIPVFKSEKSTSVFMAELIVWLKYELAPRISIHGVLVDIYGEGILIMGESGIGKSETALELIKRGHRLVADDVVEIKKASDKELVGSSPAVIRHFIELRGIGIIDVKELFGVESVKGRQNIDMIIKLEVWDPNKEYDRLGLNEEYMEILGNNVVSHSIPIRPGRNLAIIAEAAAINHRQKAMGYNAAKALNDRVMGNIKKRQEERDN